MIKFELFCSIGGHKETVIVEFDDDITDNEVKEHLNNWVADIIDMGWYVINEED